MKRKLNYIFNQILDNSKTAYKGNRGFYIGFGLLFILVNVSIYFVLYSLGFSFFTKIIPEYNEVVLMYTYLLLLILPCLTTLKKQGEPLKFWATLSENKGIVLAILGLAVGGLFVLGLYKSLVSSSLLSFCYALFKKIGNILAVIVVLFLLRLALQKRISFLNGLIEAFIVSMLVFPVIYEMKFFVTYGFIESFRYIFGSDLGEIVLIPALFILVNFFLSPLLVSMITAVVSYEEETEMIAETTNNEPL